jgi:acyl-coenzyme A synthetase/AMP-(fatty) acid ligase
MQRQVLPRAIMTVSAVTQAPVARDAAPPTADLLRGWIRDNAAERGDAPWIVGIDQGRSLRYRELAALVDRLARWLADAGVGANGRVVLLANNSIEHLVTYVGVMACGATIATVHVETNQAHLGSILAALAPRVVVYEEALGLDLPEAIAAEALWLPLGTVGADDDSLFGRLGRVASAPPRPAPSAPGDVAAICYTSGTTATPKGVVLSYGELLRNVAPTAAAFGMTAADRILDFRPFNWASAQILSALAPLRVGATLILARKFSRSRFFGWIRDFGATMAAGNPTTINMLLNGDDAVTGADLPTLRFVTSSSAPLTLQELRRFEDRFGIPIAQGFGASEIGWIAGCDETTRRPGSVGRPLPYHRLAIVAEDGMPLPPGEIGFVELGGDPAGEYRQLGADGRIETTAVGRTRTGDLGYLDADGYLFLTGRQKDLIIRGGVNIAPLEIDGVLLDQPEIAEAATVGVPDPVYGEAVVCFVVLRPGAKLSADALLDRCTARLPAPKRPKAVIFRDALPKTGRGKMDRRKLVDDWVAGNR